MEHKGTAVIAAKRLLLRRFVIEDAEAMFHNWASDEEVCKMWIRDSRYFCSISTSSTAFRMFAAHVVSCKCSSIIQADHSSAVGFATVSYTHLDVYKRQGPRCSINSVKIPAS